MHAVVLAPRVRRLTRARAIPQPAVHRILRLRSAEATVYWEVSDTGETWDLDDVTGTVEAGGRDGRPPGRFESFAASATGCAQ